jgi:hypothetical protein
LGGPTAKTAAREKQPSSVTLIRQKEKQRPKAVEYGSPLIHRPTERVSQKGSSKAVEVGRDVFEGISRRMRSPKTMAVQRIMSPRGKALTKATSLKSL